MKIFLVTGIDLVKKSKIINANSPTEAIKNFLQMYPNSTNLLVYDLPPETKSESLDKLKLNEIWELILSKIELPSTKMLLTQQGELLGFNSNNVEIALSSNWYNLIMSRRLIIENGVKKVFGKQIIVQFNIK